jgi:type I restriction enzyme M protein
MENFNQKASMIWNIADILRGGWKQHEYQDVILPLVVLKRLDSILAPTKAKVSRQNNEYHGKVNVDPILKKVSGVGFYNVSQYDFEKLTEEPSHIAKNFKNYLGGFSENIRDIFEKFDFNKQLERLEGGNLLFLAIQELNKVNLHPDAVDNHQMGLIFEELLRKFSEMSNETAGEHYTPRDVIRLMVEILFSPDQKALKTPHVIKTIYDPACGTGGMLTVAKDYILDHINKEADIYLYGQELNSITYAMAKSDMLIKGEDVDSIRGGEKDHSKASTLSNDQFFGEVYDYGLSNPPYGVDWKKDKDVVEREANRGFSGRFGAGTPRISDGQLLFLEHLVSKMRSEKDGGSRIGIVHNGSPLFTGDAGSGESEIRRWILEKDYLEAIVALPDQLFYNTGINTYLWFVTNRKSKERKGKVQLVDGRGFFKKMRKSLGNKRHEIDEEGKKKILELYQEFEENEFSKTFKTTEFAYRQITIERPLRLKFDFSDENIEGLKAVFNIASEQKNIDDKKVLLGQLEQTKDSVLEKLVQKFLKQHEDSVLVGKNFLKFIESFGRGTIYLDAQVFNQLFEENWEKIFGSGTKLSKQLRDWFYGMVSTHDEKAEIVLVDGKPVADSELRDYENVPWGTDVNDYFKKEVFPYVSDAWINESVRDHKDNQIGKVGYEIPFTRFFYKYQAPRDLTEIEGDIEMIENELLKLLQKL